MKTLAVFLITFLSTVSLYAQHPRYQSGTEWSHPRIAIDTTLSSDTVIVYSYPNTKNYPEDINKIHPGYIFNELVKANYEPSIADPMWLAMAGANLSKIQIPRFKKQFIIGSSIAVVGLAGIVKGYSLADPTYVYYNGTLVLDGDDKKREANAWKIAGAVVALVGIIIDIDSFKFLKRAELNGGPDSFCVTYPLYNLNPVLNRLNHKKRK